MSEKDMREILARVIGIKWFADEIARGGTPLVPFGDALRAMQEVERRTIERCAKVDELGRDDLRRRAKAMLVRNGWKAGDTFSAHSVVELMVSLGIDAVQTPLDRCAWPECGCCHDASCASADHSLPAPPAILALQDAPSDDTPPARKAELWSET